MDSFSSCGTSVIGNAQMANTAMPVNQNYQTPIMPLVSNQHTYIATTSVPMVLGGGGLGGQYGLGAGATTLQGYVGIGSGYGAGGICMGLLNRPQETAPAPDALYPVNLCQESSCVRFHLHIWRQSLSGDDALWSLVSPMGDGLRGYPVFRSRAGRAGFHAWWKSYQRRFSRERDALSRFLPTLEPGRVSGAFVERKTGLDAVPFSMLESFASDTARLEPGLREIVSEWSWITQNCKGRVYKVIGGWLFARPADGALFSLFSPWATNTS